MVHFWVCLCMLNAYIGLATCVLCVLLFALIFFGEDVVVSFWFLIYIDQFLQVSTFAGCTSLALSRFVFSFAYTYLGIFLGFWLVFCVFRCSNILFFICLSMLTCDHILRHNYVGLPFPPFARVLDRRCLLFALTRLYQWFMLALAHAVCSSCPFLFFFHSNVCGQEVPHEGD